jgi:hypothetical protein
MFALACDGLAALREEIPKVDEALLPRADGVLRIKRDLDRLEKRGRVHVRSAFKMLRSANGNRIQGDVSWPHIRLPDSETFQFFDPAAFVYLFRPEVEKRLLQDVGKLDFGGALSHTERRARKAELRAQIDNAERIAAEWWWKCREEGLTELPPPNVSTPALLGFRIADDSADGEVADVTANEEADVSEAYESPFVGETEEDGDDFDFG